MPVPRTTTEIAAAAVDELARRVKIRAYLRSRYRLTKSRGDLWRCGWVSRDVCEAFGWTWSTRNRITIGNAAAWAGWVHKTQNRGIAYYRHMAPKNGARR